MTFQQILNYVSQKKTLFTFLQKIQIYMFFDVHLMSFTKLAKKEENFSLIKKMSNTEEDV